MAPRPPFGKLLSGLAWVGLAALPLLAGHCPDCQKRSHTKDLGTCTLCAAMTTSGSFQLCMGCSERLQACERCKVDLPPAAPGLPKDTAGTFAYGRWTYTLEVSGAGTRSEGWRGRLFFAGSELPDPAGINDVVRTPWGPLYWVGNPATAFGAHGWMVTRKPSAPEGSRVTPPPPGVTGGTPAAGGKAAAKP